MQRAAANAACADLLAAGRGQLVVMGVELDHPLVHEVAGRVVEREAAHVQRPQIERRAALQHPLGHHLAGSTAGGDAVEEPGGDVVVVELGHAAHHEIGIGRVGDWSVEELANARSLEARRALRAELGELCETVVVRIEQLALERRRDAVSAERNRVRFVTADEQSRAIRLVVHEVIGVAHRGHLGELDRRVALDGTADQVLVLDSRRRDANTCHPADLHAPHAGGVDDHLALDVAVARVHRGAPSTVDRDRRDLRVFDDACAAHACAAGDGLRDRGRVDVAISG